MGRRTKNLAILGTLGLFAGLAALGLWWALHRAAGELGTESGYSGLEELEQERRGGIRLRSDD